MKIVTLLLASLAFSATAEPPARLMLWITDPIGATSGSRCQLPESTVAAPRLPTIQPTLTEGDVIAWNADNGRWTLNPVRFASGDAHAKLHDRCFVLAIDGKLISSGVVLSSHSARLIGFPTISVSNQNNALDLRLTSSNHESHLQLIHIDALDAVFRHSANLEPQ